MLGIGSLDNLKGPPTKSCLDISKWKNEDGDSSDSSFSSEDLNTPSYVCLLLPKISRSSIFTEPFYHFPEIEDPYLDTALWRLDEKVKHDNVGIIVYQHECELHRIMPYMRVLDSLYKTALDLKFFNLQENEMKAICAGLVDNNYVSTLILEENDLTPRCLEYFLPVITRNNTVTVLNLRHCNIGYYGAKVLGNCFGSNYDIVELDLSFNNLNDGFEYLCGGLKLNKSIKILNLSNNNLGDRAMVAFRSVMEDNYNIVSLDLSWNNIYKPLGMKELMEGLTENVSVEELNLAWNGIGEKDTVKRIMLYLKAEQSVIKHLDLSNNRITGEIPVRMLIAGLKNSDTLLTVNLGGNPFMPLEVEAITQGKGPNLKKLDFGDTWVKKSFLPIRNRARRSGCQVIHGNIYSNYQIKGPNLKELLLKRAKFVAMKQKKKKFRKDFGHFLLGIKVESVNIEGFEALLKAAKVKLDRDLEALIGKSFAKGEEKKININEIRDLYMKLYPDTKLPEKKKKKPKRKKKEE